MSYTRGQENPQAGERYAGGRADADLEVGVGGPVLSERGGRSANAEGSEAEPDLPDSEGYGNFAEVETEPLPGLVPQAGQTSFSYDDEMRLTDVQDTEGAKRTLGYDPAGRMVSKRYPFKAGGPIDHAYAYDRHGNLTSFTDGEDVETTFGYDGLDRRVSEVAPGALGAEGDSVAQPEVTRFSFDSNGNLTARETPRGTRSPTAGDYSFEYGFDSLDRLVSETNAEGEQWTYDFDVAGNRVGETSPRGNAGEIGPDGESFDTTFDYDAAGRLASQTDGLDHDTSYSYDADSNLVKVVAPGAETGADGAEADRVTETVYDGRGLSWKETTGTGGETRTRLREFDPNGNLRRVVNPRGVTDGDAIHVDSGSDAEADLADPTLHAEVRVYDSDDLLVGSYLPWGERDDRDRRRFKRSFIRDSRGWVESIDAAHELDAANAPRTSYEHFESGWVASASDEHMVDPDSGAPVESHLVDYDYDGRGDQVLWDSKSSGESPKGRRITRSFYDNATLKARAAERVAPDGSGDETTRRSYRYFYNANRSLAQMVDFYAERPEGQRERSTSFSRDGAERETTVNEAWASGKDTVFAYDAAGNVKSRKTDGRLDPNTGVYGNSAGGQADAKTTGFEYDVLDRETRMEVAQGPGVTDRWVERSYHPSGEPASKRSHTVGQGSDRDVVEQRYFTVHGELSELSRKRDGAPDFIKESAYDYDPNGNRTRDERGVHEFNAQDRLVRWERSSKQKNPGTAVDYQLDGTGAIRKTVDSALDPGKRETTYSYDGTRLTKTEDSTSISEFSYDDFGSVTRIRQTLKAANTVLPSVGELPTLPAVCGDMDDLVKGTTAYCFDEFERMVAAKGPGLTDDPAVYEYDGLDRRDAKITKNLAGDQRRDYGYVGTTRMLSREQNADGKTLYYDYSSAGEREGQSTSPTDTTAPDEHRSYGKDGNGSVEDLAEPDGSVASDNRYRYDPYGELDRDTTDLTDDPEADLGEAAESNPFRYQGFYYDSAVKTYDMQARQYRPDIGRFLTQDRYESATGDLNLQTDPLTQNRYAFAGGNPINNIEFDGHRVKCGGPCGSYQQNRTGKDKYANSPFIADHRETGETGAPGTTLRDAPPGTSPSGPPLRVRLDAPALLPPVLAGRLGSGQSRPTPTASARPVEKPGIVSKAVDFVNVVDLKAENPSCLLKPNSGCQAFSVFDNDLGKAAAGTAAIAAGAVVGKIAAGICTKVCPTIGEKTGNLSRRLVDETGSIGGGGAIRGAERTVGPRFTPGKWLPHFEKHGPEFGYKSSVEYLRGARDLVGREGVETFTRSNGDRLFYDAARNEFAATRPDGILRTYFRPKPGGSYWKGQTGG